MDWSFLTIYRDIVRAPGIIWTGIYFSVSMLSSSDTKKDSLISSIRINLKLPTFRQKICKDRNIVCSRIKIGKAPLPRASPVRNQQSWYGTCHTLQRSLHLNEVDGGSAQRHHQWSKEDDWFEAVFEVKFVLVILSGRKLLRYSFETFYAVRKVYFCTYNSHSSCRHALMTVIARTCLHR